MQVNFNSSPNFKGYIPIKYYAKDSERGVYRPIATKEYLRKCNNFVVRNLNGTAQKAKCDEFVDEFKKHDPDYVRISAVKSVYDKEKPIVHLVTGRDIDVLNNMGKNIGIAKHQSINALGHSHSFEAKVTANKYYNDAKSFIQRNCRRLKSENGKNLSLRVFFDPKYKKNGEVKGFEYLGSQFYEEV